MLDAACARAGLLHQLLWCGARARAWLLLPRPSAGARACALARWWPLLLLFLPWPFPSLGERWLILVLLRQLYQ